MNPKNYFDQIPASFKRSRPRPYTPHFRIVREQKDWRIFDGKKEIARFMPMALDIWSFSPFEPDEMANVEPPGKVVDLHTVHNTVINFGMQTWPRHWLLQGEIEEHLKWTWLKKSGAELVARVSVSYADNESGHWLLRVRYDPAWGRYRYTCDIDVRKLEPGLMEPFNLMTAGAWVDRVERRRWTHSIWENADGELRRIVHSNALFFCTDYASGPKNDYNGPWRWRSASYPRAWIGYAAHKSFNPVVLVHRTNVPLLLGTCSGLFDEHICWNTAGQDNLDENGYFHFQMSVELVNLGPSLAGKFLDQARDPRKPKRWHQETIALPFHMDRVNSFEQALDPWAATDCPMVVVPRAKDGGVVWEEGIAHSGRRSIRLKANGFMERRELPVTGAVCSVRPHHRYQLSGWIRTRGVERFARLELNAYEYTPGNHTASAESAPVSGNRDWTRVTLELNSGDSVYVMPNLVLYGSGTAWFDDLRLELIS